MEMLTSDDGDYVNIPCLRSTVVFTLNYFRAQRFSGPCRYRERRHTPQKTLRLGDCRR